MHNRRSLENISDMFRVQPVKRQSVAFAPRTKKKPIKLGTTCPKCFEKKSLTGLCFCNI